MPDPDAARCRSCDTRAAGGPGSGGMCSECLASEAPPLAERGAKWSPLALGVLSIFCDPLMIPTLLAIWRGFAELRDVGRREARGIYREEHAAIRTGAMWGILLAAARPLVIVLALLYGVLAAAMEDERSPVLPADELAEILERVRSDDEEARDLALAHLDELAPTLSSNDTIRVLDAAESLPLEVRSSMIGSAASSPALPMHLPRFARAYPSLDPYGRFDVLHRLAALGTPEALAELGRLAGADHDPEGPALPVMPLDRHRADAQLFVAPLVRLPAEASLRAGVGYLLASYCRAGLGDGVLAPVRDRLLADWEATRAVLPRTAAQPSPERSRLAWSARLQLEALRCLAGDDVDAAFIEASRHEDSRIAAAAIEALLDRGHDVDRSTLRRLAADPYSRVEIVVALRAFGREHEVPAAHCSEQALAESQLVREADFALERLTSPRWIARVEPEPGVAVHVFSASLLDFEGVAASERVAIGPYPESIETESPTIVWESELGGVDPNDVVAALARALLERRAEQLDEEGVP